MTIAPWSWFNYHTVLHGMSDGAWTGTAEDDGFDSLLGTRPSVLVTSGRVTLTRSSRGASRSVASAASFDGGDALDAVLHEGDFCPAGAVVPPRSDCP